MERHTINIDKEDFNYIKGYCDKKNIKIVKWMTELSINEIENELSKAYSLWTLIKEKIGIKSDQYRLGIYGEIYFYSSGQWRKYGKTPDWSLSQFEESDVDKLSNDLIAVRLRGKY